jgi:hypothetical protein
MSPNACLIAGWEDYAADEHEYQQETRANLENHRNGGVAMPHPVREHPFHDLAFLAGYPDDKCSKKTRE